MGWFNKDPAEQRKDFGKWFRGEWRTDFVDGKWQAKPLKKKTVKKTTKAKAPEYVPGYKEGYKPVTEPNKAPTYMKAVKSRTAGLMNKKVFEQNTISTSQWGPAKQFKGHTGPAEGNYGDVRQITEDTKYGGMQKQDYQVKTSTKKKKKKDVKKGTDTLTQMQRARASMGFKKGGRFGY